MSAGAPVVPAVYYWNRENLTTDPGSGGDGTWSTTSPAPANWKNQGATTNVVWMSAYVADFAGAKGTVTLGSTISAAGIIFDTAGYTLDGTGRFLTIGASGLVTNNTSGVTKILGTASATASQTWTVAAGGTLQFDATFNGTTPIFQLNSAGTTNISNTFTVTGRSTLSSAGSSGTINFSGTETFQSSGFSDSVGISNVTVNHTAGTATFAPGTSAAFYVGNTGSAALGSILNVTGGTAQMTSTAGMLIGGGSTSGSTTAGAGTLSVGGGAGTATFTTGSSGNSSTISLGNANATGTINLNANGLLITNRAIDAGFLGQGTINFNGGKLQNATTSTSVAGLTIGSLMVANILDGGATIDTNGGNAGIATGLLNGGTGVGGLTKNGAGTLTLAGVNTYGGSTVITAGTLALSNTGNQALVGNITGAGALTQNGSGVTTISGANSYNGGTTVSAGVLDIATTSSLPGYDAASQTITPAKFSVASGATLALQVGPNAGQFSTTAVSNLRASASVAAGAFSGIDTAGNDVTYVQNLTGSVGLAKLGSGMLTLTGTNAYAAPTAVYAGTLRLGSATTLSAAAPLTVLGGTLDLNKTNQTTTVLSGAGTIVNNGGTGTSTLTVGSNTTSAVTLADNTAGSGNVALNVVGAYTTSAASTHSGGTTVGPNASLQLAGSTTAAAGIGPITLNATSAALLLAGPTTVSNDITGSGVVMANVAGLSAVTLGGTLSYTGGTYFRNAANVVTFAPSSDSTLSGVIGAVTTVSGVATVSGGSIVKSGDAKLTLTGRNLYTGGTIIAGGTLNLGVIQTSAGGPLGGAGAASTIGLVQFTGGTLQYSSVNQTDYSGRFSTAASQAFNIDTNGQTVTFATPLASVGGMLTKAGAGTLVLVGTSSAGSTYSGVTTISGGTLQLGDGTANVATIGSGAIVNDAALVLKRLGAWTLNNNVSGGGTITQAGSAVTFGGVIGTSGGIAIGTGGATLQGANTYTGETVVNGLVDLKTNDTALGATGAVNGTTVNAGGTVRVNGSALNVAEAFTLSGGSLSTFNAPGTTSFSGPITLTVGSAIQISPQSQTNTTTVFSGQFLEGATVSNLTFVRTGQAGGASNTASTDVVSITAANSYAGNTFVTDALPTNAGTFSVKLSGGDNRLPTTTILTLGGANSGGVTGGSGRLILGDAATGPSNQSLAGLTTNGSGTANAVVGGHASVSTLTLDVATGTNALPNTFAGKLGGNGANENNLALTKTGGGTVALSGTNTYAGGTSVTGGTLQANNATSSLGGGTTTVTGGVLAGISGKTGGDVVVGNGGTITAGSGAMPPQSPAVTTADTISTLTTAAQTWSAGGAYRLKFAASGTAGTGNDLLSMTTLNLSGLASTNAGTKFTIVLLNTTANAFKTTNGPYTIAKTSGGVTLPGKVAAGNGQNLTDLFVLDTSNINIPSDTAFQVSLSSSGGGFNVQLECVGTPEPTTPILVTLAGSAVLGRRRRTLPTAPF